MRQRLKKLSLFQAEHFEPGSAPTMKTLRTWVDDGTLPGRKIGGMYYIDMAKYEATTGNALVDKVLKAA